MKNDSQQEERLAWRLKEKQILYDERWLHLESRSYQLEMCIRDSIRYRRARSSMVIL